MVVLFSSPFSSGRSGSVTRRRRDKRKNFSRCRGKVSTRSLQTSHLDEQDRSSSGRTLSKHQTAGKKWWGTGKKKLKGESWVHPGTLCVLSGLYEWNSSYRFPLVHLCVCNGPTQTHVLFFLFSFVCVCMSACLCVFPCWLEEREQKKGVEKEKETRVTIILPFH